MRTAKTMK